MHRFFLTVALAAMFAALAAGAPRCEKGVLDLSRAAGGEVEPTPLDGEWEFYWGQMLSPADLASADAPKPVYANVPGAWTDIIIGNQKLPSHGYATYRLRVKVPPYESQVTYGVAINIVYSSYVLFANGEITGKVGTISKNEKGSRPAFSSEVVPVTLRPGDGQEIELVMLVSNHEHWRCGLDKPLEIGLYTDMVHRHRKSGVFKMLIIGILLAITFRSIFVFVSDRKGKKHHLYFSVLCFVLVARTLATDNMEIAHLFPGIHWNALLRIWDMTSVWMTILITQYFGTLFAKYRPKRTSNLIVGVGLVLGALIAFAPNRLYESIYKIPDIYSAVGALYVLLAVALRAGLNKEPQAIFAGVGVGLVYITSIPETLYNILGIHMNDISEIGIALFAMNQSWLSMHNTAEAFTANTRLNRTVLEERDTLEQRIEERTRELQAQSRELAQHQQKAEEQNRINVGIARMNEVTARHNGDYKSLCANTLEMIVKHIGAQVGAIYVVDRGAEPPELELVADYGMDKETKWNKSRMPADQGLLGETIQFRTTHTLRHIPAGFLAAQPGQEAPTPKVLTIAPLATENEVLGAIEIASQNEIGELERDFLGKATAIVTNHINTTLANDRNQELIRDLEARARHQQEDEERLQDAQRELQETREEIEELRHQLSSL